MIMATEFINFYQHLPEHINPIVFSFGFFSLRWYSLMYLAGFAAVYFLLEYRIKKGEYKILKFSNNNQLANLQLKNLIFDVVLYCFMGLLIGARLGYVIFYNPEYYLENPLAVISPINNAGDMVGISGMSYFGGFVGVIIAGCVFAKKRGISFLKLADFVAPAVPAGYFFGRVGNFLNGELYGRITEEPWGMYFSDGVLRHPSQLYEAFFEGIILFALLWPLRNGLRYKNKLFYGSCFILYALGYAFFRFVVEFFREPDQQIDLIWGLLTLGQAFSIILAFMAGIIFIIQKKKNAV